MKVDSIKNVSQIQTQKAPQFRGKGMNPEIWNHLNQNSGKVSRFLNYVGENQGEALNIIVTAVGTAIICPLFIAFNPFSKEDDKTKQYSAWRQPISAVIALVTQLTITKWFNDWLANAACTRNKDGSQRFTRANLIHCPPERELKRRIKLEHPEYDKKQIAAEVKERQIDAEKEEVARQRRLNPYKPDAKPIEYKELVCQDYIDEAKKQIFKEFKSKNQAEIESKFGKPIDKINSLRLNNHLEKMLKEKASEAGKDVQTYLNEAAVKLVERDVVVETISKLSIRHLWKNYKNKDGQNYSVKDAIAYCSDKEKLNIDHIIKLIREQRLEEKLPEGYDIKKLAQDMVDKLTHIHDFERGRMADFTSLKNLGETFEEILHNVKLKKMVRSRNSDAKRVFKTMNTQLGLVVTLATLPFTCGFLNWCYPRIMEKIMPEMAAKKKDIEGKISDINAKIEEAIDKINLDELKDVVNIDELKNRLKFEVEKGGDD